ncbi:MAG: hypothetical protein GY917_00185, partial [Planctomycetaceae bacterium]|nr:hypothetical protein [Planctomycetaceae bacterium]
MYHRPVIALDATATALVAGGLELDDKIDGVDLLPWLTGKQTGDPHEALYWRWLGQAAIRAGDWKYLQADDRAYLFDLSSEQHEKQNLIAEHPGKAAGLKKKLVAWSQQLVDPGLARELGAAGGKYFDHYLDGKIEPEPKPGGPAKPVARGPESLFKSRDKNRDGFLTLKEFIGSPQGRNVPVLTKRFKGWDRNNDSKVTLQEMKGT